MKQLYPLAPHNRLSQNPLFNLEVRLIRWGYSQQKLIDYSLRRVGGIVGLVLLVWFLLAFREPVGALQSTSYLLIATLVATLPLDYIYISSALGSINSDLVGNRWNLLRLTPLSDGRLIAAKHGAAQVRAWRWMITVVALRLGLLFAVCGNTVAFLLGANFYGSLTTAGRLSGDLGFMLAGVAALLLYACEPYWRMRAVTALGVAISARARTQTSAVLAGLGAVVALWLAQGVVALAVVLISSLLLVPIAFAGAGMLQATAAFCSLGLLLGLIAAAVYGFYSIVQSWSLRRAERWIARID